MPNFNLVGAASNPLAPSSIQLTGSTTVQQLCSLLAGYIGHTVLPTVTIAALGLDPDLLAVSVNAYWNLAPIPNAAYLRGELQATWTVQQLADDIDKRVAVGIAAGIPSGHTV